MTDKDIIVIYSKDIFVAEEAKKFVETMLSHEDETTKIIPVPSEWVKRVVRL